MTNVSFDKSPRVSKAWIALKRLDKNDDRVVALREVSIPAAADVTMMTQIITTTFGLNSSEVIFKIRNHRGCLIPLNSSIPANSKHVPYVLEVVKTFQHVCPKPRTVPMTVINKSMKTRLQTIDRRIQRLEELLPQIKLRRNEKLSQEIDSLNQKLRFLHKRMQVAESHHWKGVLTRAPLW
ncbi:uncharacterized protein si:zfos-1056e6.1 isoform X2 [Centropristis striata]|uniref:uncharacterized protein si:zfos-1056e6.1 isoform X2 n=1 Tax=Centropristis striata TaxID=184440 RepID=UPI0027DF99CC|nr:uncharacterized protein si:zfos-1056e6.1 isoform X2 [Centropristis striata]